MDSMGEPCNSRRRNHDFGDLGKESDSSFPIFRFPGAEYSPHMARRVILRIGIGSKDHGGSQAHDG